MGKNKQLTNSLFVGNRLRLRKELFGLLQHAKPQTTVDQPCPPLTLSLVLLCLKSNMYYITTTRTMIVVFFSFLFCYSLATSQHLHHEPPHALGVTLLTALMTAGLYGGPPIQHRKGTRGVTIKRVRRSVSSIMYELGGYSRRFFRMHDASFWLLHKLLKDKINGAATQSHARSCRSRKKRKRTAPNGVIHSSARLSIALRYFAGGDHLDITLVHGVSHSEVLKSVWIVVDAVHQTPELDINFPIDHAEQRLIRL